MNCPTMRSLKARMLRSFKFEKTFPDLSYAFGVTDTNAQIEIKVIKKK